MALSDGQKERIKLRANFFNGIAVANIVAAMITVTLLNVSADDYPSQHWVTRQLVAVLGLVLGGVLHWLAGLTLLKLDHDD